MALHSLWLHRSPARCRILVALPTAHTSTLKKRGQIATAARKRSNSCATLWKVQAFLPHSIHISHFTLLGRNPRTVATYNALHFRLKVRPCAFSRTAEGWRGVRCRKMARSAAQQGFGAQRQPCASHTRATPAIYMLAVSVSRTLTVLFVLPCHLKTQNLKLWSATWTTRSSAERCHSTGRNVDRCEFPRNVRDRLDLTLNQGESWSVARECHIMCGRVRSLKM